MQSLKSIETDPHKAEETLLYPKATPPLHLYNLQKSNFFPSKEPKGQPTHCIPKEIWSSFLLQKPRCRELHGARILSGISQLDQPPQTSPPNLKQLHKKTGLTLPAMHMTQVSRKQQLGLLREANLRCLPFRMPPTCLKS